MTRFFKILILYILLLFIFLPISLGSDDEHVDLKTKILNTAYFSDIGRAGIIEEYQKGNITANDIQTLDSSVLYGFLLSIKVDEDEVLTDTDKQSLTEMYQNIENNSNIEKSSNSEQLKKDLSTFKDTLNSITSRPTSSVEDNTENNTSLEETIGIITKDGKENTIKFYNAAYGSMTELADIINTTVLETTWDKIPTENRFQYLNFLKNLSTNSELNKVENENYLTYLQERVNTIDQSELSDTEKKSVKEIKENLEKREAAVNEEYKTKVKELQEYIFKNPDVADTPYDSSSTIDGVIEDAASFLELSQESPVNEDSLSDFSSQLYNILLAIGISAAVIVGGIIGIKLITSSVEQKAQVKKFLVPYVIGCIIVFGGFGIWKLAVTSLQGSTDSLEASSSSSTTPTDELEIADPSTTITLDRTLIILDPNRQSTAQLTATITPGEADLKWISSNSSVASVNDSGRISAKSIGSATITAEIRIGENKTTMAKCNIVVVPTKEIPQEAYVLTDISSKTTNVSSFIESLDFISKKVEEDYRNSQISNWTYHNSRESATFEKAQKKNNKRTNCAVYINWALKEIGAMKTNQKFWKASVELSGANKIVWKNGAEATIRQYADIILVRKTPNQLLKEGNLKKGDICLWTAQHTNAYAGDKKWYDAGRIFVTRWF